MALASVVGADFSRPGAQEQPLPDQAAFLAETRTHLQTDSALQSSYMYVETRRERKLDRRGRVTQESRSVIENYPGFPGEPRWERVLEKDGTPVSASTLEAQDRERRRRADEYARRMAAQPKKEYARQVREWEKYRDEAAERVDDIFRVFDIRMLGRERIGGYDTIAFALTPRRDARPRTREGGMLRRFSVRAWISEADHELVKLDATAIRDLPFAWGLLARLHKGANLSFERRKVNDEVWLPAMVTYTGSARVGLIATIRRSGESEYSRYRKFSVDTSTAFTP
ncbi:MAG: hypothetical protein FJW14_12035 [Acidimicrobiia bacterium]|nr:hypothetical protein [Acidimicrobiia bacterium]